MSEIRVTGSDGSKHRYTKIEPVFCDDGSVDLTMSGPSPTMVLKLTPAQAMKIAQALFNNEDYDE